MAIDEGMSEAATGPAQRHIEDVYDSAPFGYISALPDGTIVTINRTLLRWGKYRREELVARRRFQDLLTVGGRIFYETHYAPLLRMQGFINEVAFDLLCDGDGQLPTLVNTVQELDAAGRPALLRIYIFNATDRRRYERELLAAKRRADEAADALRTLNETLEQRVADEVAERIKTEEALRQAQKMEALGQLTGGVAHDFNNLLTIILGGLDVIGRHLPALPASPATARIGRAQDMALQGVKRAATLTQRLLAFSRRQPLDPKPLDANALVSGMSELLRRTLGEMVQMETVLAGGLWSTRADANQLENALLNLAVNARDAMPQGGRLTIETANASLDDAYVAGLVEPVPPGQYVLIAVGDTGHGMDKATLARVFEPFFTTKEAGKGTGLGLSQVYGFVRQSEGHVTIYSELGQGTTVKIYLPRLQEEAAQARPEQRAVVAPPASVGDETVLVVEDETTLRSYAADMLQELGYQVLEAANGPEALDLLRQHPEVQLLFTDVVLPGGMNGRELADEAVQRCPGLKVLYTTGYTRNAIVHHGRLDPGVQLLSKPYAFAELAAKIRAVLDSP